MIDKDKLLQDEHALDNIVMAIRAQGGYKYRQRVKATDHELDEYITNAERELRLMVARHAAALAVIEDWGKEHAYQIRCDEALAVLHD